MELVYICLDMNKIKTLIFLNSYIFYALLKDAFGERVRMLYTDTDSFFLHFFRGTPSQRDQLAPSPPKHL